MTNILEKFKRFLKGTKRNYIALDLGTANTLVYIAGQGIVYNEPSMIAYDLSKNNQLFALGHEAFEIIGKTNDNIKIIEPLVDGVISDLDAALDLLQAIFKKLQLSNMWKNAIVVLACPSGITQLERDGLKKVAYNMGAKIVIVEEEVKMAAIGADININLPSGNLVLDIGGGTTDIAVIASKGVIISRSIKVAGNLLDDEIKKYIRGQYNISIGIKSIIELKHAISSLSETKENKKFIAYGRNVLSGRPEEINITADEIRPVIITQFNRISEVLTEVLESTPPELAGDIIKNGITICGGGALIAGIDEYFSSKFNIKVKVANDPLKCVIEGTKRIEKEIYQGL
ncbi:rod shape-determining protein [Spiroplasma endosymbiont of Lonchoptera lutea]|uniref:rod shape-determining protein n=1 Tax=Spiroplasma endosymbiont of Lonchoptera lutea TaxID=3066297 RepID=UPI0030CF1A52